MRRRKPLAYIPKNKKLIERANKIFATLSSPEELEADGENTPGQTSAFIKCLNDELEIISGKLRLTNKITPKFVFDYLDGYDKATLSSITLYVKRFEMDLGIMTMPMFVGTTDGQTWDVVGVEDDYPISDTEIAELVLSPSRKSSQINYKEICYVIRASKVSQNVQMNDFLNAVDPEKAQTAHGVIG